MRPDRRKFIRDTLYTALAGASVYSALGQMKLLQAAATHHTNYVFSDYKALVCIFLYGGNDSFNTVVPYTQSAFNSFYGASGVRPQLALNRNLMTGKTVLNAPTSGAGSPGDGNQYALNPAMGPQLVLPSGGTGASNLTADLATVFNAGHAAIVANTGTLVQPVTQNDYQNGAPALPPQLYSHSDQTAYWQSSPPSNTPLTGWGGRLADLVASANPAGVPILTGVNSQDIFLRGQNVNGYIMNAGSASTLGLLNGNSGGTTCANPGAVYDYNVPTATAFCNLQGGVQANALERAYAASLNHSIDTAGVINTALGGAPAFNAHDQFPDALSTGYDLDAQLQTVAQLIWAAKNGAAGTGLTRQVFFVTAGGYDTHSDELTQHAGTANDPGILALLSRSLAGFYNALNSVGIADAATAFTASDFGRTMTTNNGGTDHGWGSHHFVVGGAVKPWKTGTTIKGGQFFGNGCGFPATQQAANFGLIMPSLLNPTQASGVYNASPNLNDSGDGYGRVIPTTSIDQYAATLAKWFLTGAGSSYDPTSDINLVYPNLANFSIKNLGFV
jgi:uncharacterized protein (DUF1501 family)